MSGLAAYAASFGVQLPGTTPCTFPLFLRLLVTLARAASGGDVQYVLELSSDPGEWSRLLQGGCVVYAVDHDTGMVRDAVHRPAGSDAPVPEGWYVAAAVPAGDAILTTDSSRWRTDRPALSAGREW